jgi:hypothetical protein
MRLPDDAGKPGGECMPNNLPVSAARDAACWRGCCVAAAGSGRRARLCTTCTTPRAQLAPRARHSHRAPPRSRAASWVGGRWPCPSAPGLPSASRPSAATGPGSTSTRRRRRRGSWQRALAAPGARGGSHRRTHAHGHACKPAHIDAHWHTCERAHGAQQRCVFGPAAPPPFRCVEVPAKCGTGAGSPCCYSGHNMVTDKPLAAAAWGGSPCKDNSLWCKGEKRRTWGAPAVLSRRGACCKLCRRTRVTHALSHNKRCHATTTGNYIALADGLGTCKANPACGGPNQPCCRCVCMCTLSACVPTTHLPAGRSVRPALPAVAHNTRRCTACSGPWRPWRPWRHRYSSAEMAGSSCPGLGRPSRGYCSLERTCVLCPQLAVTVEEIVRCA